MAQNYFEIPMTCSKCKEDYFPRHQFDECPHKDRQTPVEILMAHGMTEEEAKDFVEGTKRGLKAIKEGKVIPWSKVKEKLGI